MFRFLLYSLLFISCLVKSKIEIRDANVAAISRDDIGLIFYITVSNTDTKGYEIKTKALKCTEEINEKDKDSTYMYLIGGHMGYMASHCYKNLTLIHPTMILHNRKGFCIILIKFKSDNDIVIVKRANISFDTTVYRSHIPPMLRMYYQKHEVHTCESEDLDPLNKCKRVDCAMKYGGTRNYYNKKWKRCQRVPNCIADPVKDMPDVFYSPISNKCRGYNKIEPRDLVELDGGLIDFHGSCEDLYHSYANIDCHFGKFNNRSGLCNCNVGWKSATADRDSDEIDLFIYHMCNIETENYYDRQSGKAKLLGVSIGIASVIIAMCIVLAFAYTMTIINWLACRKNCEKRKEKLCYG